MRIVTSAAVQVLDRRTGRRRRQNVPRATCLRMDQSLRTVGPRGRIPVAGQANGVRQLCADGWLRPPEMRRVHAMWPVTGQTQVLRSDGSAGPPVGCAAQIVRTIREAPGRCVTLQAHLLGSGTHEMGVLRPVRIVTRGAFGLRVVGRPQPARRRHVTRAVAG